MRQHKERIVGSREMLVKHPIGDANRVVCLEPAYRIVVDLNLINAGDAQCDQPDSDPRNHLAVIECETSAAAQDACQKRIRMWRFIARCQPRKCRGLHAHYVGRYQQNSQHEREQNSECDERAEYLYRWNRRKQKGQKPDRRGQRCEQHRCKQVIQHVRNHDFRI